MNLLVWVVGREEACHQALWSRMGEETVGRKRVEERGRETPQPHSYPVLPSATSFSARDSLGFTLKMFSKFCKF